MLDWAWRSGLASRPSLDPDAIVAAAAKREGGPPGDGEWRGRLEILCTALQEEASLNPLGQTMANRQLVKLVAARIRAKRWFAAHPHVLDRPLQPPVIIVGQMRSGTTRIHRLLACDPAFACNRLFEQLDPIPPLRRTFGIDRRRIEARATGVAFRWFEPALAAIHPSSADAVEEEFGLHAFSLWGPMFEGQWRVPTFARHVENADPRPVYREFAALLQLIGWTRGDDPARPWLLKAPQFSQDLDALLAQFPDARLIVLDRPAAQVVASGASLVWHHMRIQSDAVTREEIGAEWLRKTVLRGQRLRAVLDGGVDHLALDFDAVSNDWRSAIHRIYGFLGRTLDPDVERRMARFTARSTAHHGHRYALADFGLDEGRVREALA